jgi:hypothetical protein
MPGGNVSSADVDRACPSSDTYISARTRQPEMQAACWCTRTSDVSILCTAASCLAGPAASEQARIA